MPKPLGSSRYMPGLDGLRAIAVFAVIAYHLNLPWMPGGLLGVGVFFVLSGYLITDILFKQYARKGRLELRQFWISRARRLLPAMIMMLVLVSLWLLVTDPSRLASMKGEVVSALLYYSNWRLIFHNVSYFESFGPPSPLGHLWSLAVEEQFYLVWPMALMLLVRVVKRRGRLMLWILAGAALSAGAMALLYIPGVDPSRIYYGTDTRAFGLLIGAALAVIWPSWKLSQSLSRRGVMAVDVIGTGGLLVVALMIATVGEYDAFLYRGGMVVLSVAAAAVVAAMAHPASRLARAIGSKPLQWLGARSYGIYLYHYPIIALTTPAAQAQELHPLRALIQVLASIALAELSWRYVEEPIRQGALWGKLRSSRLTSRGRSMKGSRTRMLACMCVLVIAGVVCSTNNNWVQGDNGQVPASNDVSSTDGHTLPEVLPSTDGRTPPEGQPSTDGRTPPDGLPSTDGPTPPDGSNVAIGNDVVSVDYPSSGETEVPLGDDGTNPDTPLVQPIAGDGVAIIGDSVILDAQPFLEKLMSGIVVDGKIGRQMNQVNEVIADLKAHNELGRTVVIELGTNGSFTRKQLGRLIDDIGAERTIYFVNTRVPRKWQDVVNEMLAEAVTDKPNIHLIDWYSATKGRENLFDKDGVHLKSAGGEFLANLIVNSLK